MVGIWGYLVFQIILNYRCLHMISFVSFVTSCWESCWRKSLNIRENLNSAVYSQLAGVFSGNDRREWQRNEGNEGCMTSGCFACGNPAWSSATGWLEKRRRSENGGRWSILDIIPLPVSTPHINTVRWIYDFLYSKKRKLIEPLLRASVSPWLGCWEGEPLIYTNFH